MRLATGLFVISWAVTSACAPTYQIFPSKVMEDVDPKFDFSHWRMATDEPRSKKVQLGGRIVQSQVSGETVTIVVSQLPIVNHPTYGPKDNGKNNGDFVVFYRGQVDSADLQRGNRVMVVGAPRPWKVVTVNELSRNFPIVEAHCLHFWHTQGREIEDFPFYEAGYVTIKQETVCAKLPSQKN